MPRTKRNKLVSLTKTPKRNTRSAKGELIDQIQQTAEKYPTCCVFLLTNQRTSYLQEVRSLWKENSRIFVGKNRVIAKAIGQDEQSEVKPGLSGIGKQLQGPVGVLFTTSSPEEVQEWFEDYSRDDFARAGNVATKDVILEQGPVQLALDPPENLPHSLEPQLRALGMPTELRRGVPTLIERFSVCKQGEKITSEKAQILKHLLIKDSKFRLIPFAYWTEADGEVKEFALKSAEDSALVQQHKRAEAKGNGQVKRARKADQAMEESEHEDVDLDAEDDEDEDLIEARDKAMMMPAGV